MAEHKCRICQKFIINKIDEIAPYHNTEFLHKKCYEDWYKTRNNYRTNQPAEFWFYATKIYIEMELKMPNIDWNRFRRTWIDCLNKGFTAKDIYFTLRYMYFIRHLDPRNANGGIGIVTDTTYKEAKAFWEERTKRQDEMRAAEPKEIKKIIIKREPKKKSKIKYDLSKIEEWENGR